MISEGPTLIEALPGSLQDALNGALRPDEELLIAVRGNTREAFAATRERLLVLREPAIRGTAPVEVLEASLAGVSNVRAEPKPVGGRLTWETVAAGAPTFIEFPTYESSKYSLVAKRLQEMIGERRTPSTSGTAPEPPTVAGGRACPKCQTPIPAEGSWCPKCGLQAADPCWECGRALPDGANFCAHCGTPNTEPAVVQCPQCQAMVGRGKAYCSACGAQARLACSECDRPLRRDQEYCGDCGGEPAMEDGDAAPEGGRARAEEPEVAGAWTRTPPRRDEAEVHNAAAVKAYEAGNAVEAARLFRMALEADPDNAGYWTNLGVAYGELGDDMQAFSAYRRAVELDPGSLQAHLNMGYLYTERERFSEARETWEKIIRLAPDSEEADEARQNLKSGEDV